MSLSALFPASVGDIPAAHRLGDEPSRPIYVLDGEVRSFDGPAAEVCSPITIGALSAILLNIFLPEEHLTLEENDYEPEAHLHSVLEEAQEPRLNSLASDLEPLNRPN